MKINLSLIIMFVCIIFVLAACSSGGGGSASEGCTVISVAGEPDLTNKPSFTMNTLTAGDLVTITVPVDADVSFIKLQMVSSLLETNIYVEPVASEAVIPGDQNWQYEIDTSGYVAGSYFPDIELCSDPNSCTGLSSGKGVSYFNNNFNTTDTNFVRKVVWDNGAVDKNNANSCIGIPYLKVN